MKFRNVTHNSQYAAVVVSTIDFGDSSVELIRRKLAKVADPHFKIYKASPDFRDPSATLFVNNDVKDRMHAWRGVDLGRYFLPKAESGATDKELERASFELDYLEFKTRKIEKRVRSVLSKRESIPGGMGQTGERCM